MKNVDVTVYNYPKSVADGSVKAGISTGTLLNGGVDHIVEVAFVENINTAVEVLAQGGYIAAYATNVFTPETPFWLLTFSNAKIFFVGSDDIPVEAKIDAAHAINRALESGWPGINIAERFTLDNIAQAHEMWSIQQHLDV